MTPLRFSLASVAGGALLAALSAMVGIAATPVSVRATAVSEIGRALADGTRWTIDVSARVSTPSREPEVVTQEFVGLDLHKVVSSRHYDWATLRVQLYGSRIDGLGRSDTDLQYRFVDLNITRFFNGMLNLRVGHFEVPFGLEYPIDTNGTLRDYLSGTNLGLKSDWGLSVNGVLPSFEYELALSRGSGNEYDDGGDPFIVAGRVGTSRDRNLIVGLSGFCGRLYDQPDQTRTRIGLDAQYFYRLFSVLGEFNAGRTGSNDEITGLAELNWRSPNERWRPYFQTVYQVHESVSRWDAMVHLNLGIEVHFNRHFDVAFQHRQDVATFDTAPLDGFSTVQARYRF